MKANATKGEKEEKIKEKRELVKTQIL